jgi:3-hydroxyacyl-[acyl-carrier-protein] dehydratase
MPPPPLIDVTQFDYDHPLVDLEGIRAVVPQRHEMEQLTGIVHIDRENHLIVGFKDVRPDEFWVRGHMPGYPLMPGVLMCEAVAQLSSYYVTIAGLLAGDFVAFGGIEDVKFRGVVRPGDRLILAAKATEIRPGRRAKFYGQAFVGKTMVFEGTVIGVPFRIGASSVGATGPSDAAKELRQA